MGQAPPKKNAKSQEYLEDLLRKRIEFVKHLNADLQCNKGVLAQTVASYSDILDEIFTDIAVQSHRAVRTGIITKESEASRKALTAPRAGPPLPLYQPGKKAKTPVLDVFGHVVSQQARDEVSCMHCNRRIAACRFAPHLEKCLGKGRNASRLASRRGGNA